jgi:uncharacterized protein YndB with AHSA1/START domain
LTTGDAIVVERRIAAPAHAIYPYLVDPRLTPRWLGLTSTLDARPGGAFRLESPNAMVAEGTVVETIQDRKVSFTWGWNGHPGVPPGSTLVEIELIPEGDGTLVRISHSRLGSDEQRIHRQGWTHYLQRLDTAATGGDPGPDPGAG